MKSETLQKHTQLVRTLEAALQIRVPNKEDLAFRGSLVNCFVANLPEMEATFAVRVYEAAAAVEFPSPEVTLLRHALECRLGEHFKLRAYRASAPLKT